MGPIVAEPLSDIEIQRMKREGRERIMSQVQELLRDTPAKKEPRWVSVWVLAGVSTGALGTALYIVIDRLVG